MMKNGTTTDEPATKGTVFVTPEDVTISRDDLRDIARALHIAPDLTQPRRIARVLMELANKPIEPAPEGWTEVEGGTVQEQKAIAEPETCDCGRVMVDGGCVCELEQDTAETKHYQVLPYWMKWTDASSAPIRVTATDEDDARRQVARMYESIAAANWEVRLDPSFHG